MVQTEYKVKYKDLENDNVLRESSSFKTFEHANEWAKNEFRNKIKVIAIVLPNGDEVINWRD